MKKKKRYLLIMLSIVSVLLIACHDVEITTIIQPDGSCMRIISVEGDSSGIPESAFPIVIDSTWEVSKKSKTNEKSKFIYIIKKSFQNISGLNEAYQPSTDSVLYIQPNVKLIRRFRWFYTFFRYEETYKAHGLMFTTPDSSLKQKLAELATKQDSLEGFDLEEELIFDELFKTLVTGAREINDAELTPDVILSKKGQLRQALENSDFDFDHFTNSVLKTCQRVYQTDAVWKLKTSVTEYSKRVERYLDFMERAVGETYENKVIMPGLITSTNAKDIDGHLVSWEIDTDDFQLQDYRMWVESRRINAGPSIVTALFLIFCFVGLWILYTPERKRKAHRIMNKWLSLSFIIVGAGLFLFFGWLTISFWDFGFLSIQLISLKEKLLLAFLAIIGICLLIIGIIHQIRWRSTKYQQKQ